ncbi:MAG: cobaltochelatase subunit CobN, partial [Planctomycetes bacterium]|nr:cobaltochelatase subunit CobN [Planctomycetota bacterium]
GKAVLVPVETYRQWFEAKVPEVRRKAVVQRWGEMPGDTMVWEDDHGRKHFVIPMIELGNVILVPKLGPEDEERLKQSNRPALLKQLNQDPYTGPSHNLLASYFWQQEGFKGDAAVIWGEFTLDFLLPLRAVGMRDSDWPDILVGNIPNIRPFNISSLSFSVPAKRRTCAVLIDYLTAPAVEAGLSDELLNLSGEVIKWRALEEGALKEKFRQSITRQVREVHLDRDLGLELRDERLLAPEEIRSLGNYLDGICNETIDVNQHVFGEAPRDDLLVPWIVSCLRGEFLDELDQVIPAVPEKDRQPGGPRKYLREKAIEAVGLVLNNSLAPDEAIRAIGGAVPEEGLSKGLQERFGLARQLSQGFAKTHQEIDNLLVALDGGFVPPGPANPPERNPSVVPTGRNMYTTNPEELPSRPS